MPSSRRHALRFAAAALAGSVAGCASGALDAAESGDRTATVTGASATTDESTTGGGTRDSSRAEGSVEFPEGPKSRPERPADADLVVGRARAYAKTFEYRRVYNRLYRGAAAAVHVECGVDSVAEYGAEFRVVVRCSGHANYESDGKTVHADYFIRYATYVVGPDSTVRRDGKTETRQ